MLTKIKIITLTIIFFWGSAVDAQPLILSGNSSNHAIQIPINQTINPAGLLDKTFGGNGIFSNTNISFITTYYVPTKGIALQPDGKIILVGSLTIVGGYGRFAIMRLLENGLPDTSFGTNGITAFTHSLCGATGKNDFAQAVGIQSDGKIIIGGSTTDNSNNTHYALVRLLQNGLPDPSFAPGSPSPVIGATYLVDSITGNPTPFNDYPNKLIIQSDNKIVMGGYSSIVGIGFTFGIARFTAQGEQDPTFGAQGPSSVSGATFLEESIIEGGSTQELQALALQKDGKIIAAGGATDAGGDIFFALARFTTEGVLDDSFASGQPGNIPGTISINGRISPESTDDEIDEIALMPDDSIIAGGYSSNDSTFSYFAFARFSANGIPDASFHNALTQVPGTLYLSGPLAGGTGIFFDGCQSIALQENGTIVAAGYSSAGLNQADFCFTLARLLPTGAVDTTFGNQGITVLKGDLLPGQHDSYLETIALQSNGKILGMGWTGNGDSPMFLTAVRFINPETINAYQKAYTPVGSGVHC